MISINFVIEIVMQIVVPLLIKFAVYDFYLLKPYLVDMIYPF